MALIFMEAQSTHDCNSDVKKNPHTNLQNADICTAVRMQRVCGPDAANDNKM